MAPGRSGHDQRRRPFQVINVPTGATATLEGITITGGKRDAGGGIGNAGTLTLINTIFRATRPRESGGGLDSVGTLSITGGTISGNSAATGGGVYSVGSLYLANATINEQLGLHRRRRRRVLGQQQWQRKPDDHGHHVHGEHGH